MVGTEFDDKKPLNLPPSPLFVRCRGVGVYFDWCITPAKKIAKAQVYSSFNVADRLNIKSCDEKTRKVNFRIILVLSDQWQ
jgi:hypothetical protein